MASTVSAKVPPVRPNFSVTHHVTITEDPRKPAQVRTTLQGANEILRVVWRDINPRWFQHFSTTGRWGDAGSDDFIWHPRGITGHVEYATLLTRPRSIKGFDSYHGGSWVLTRTSRLFPRKQFVSTVPLRALTRVVFDLPPKWEIVSPMESRGPRTFEAAQRDRALTSPYGWLLMGTLDRHDVVVSNTTITIAAPTAMAYDAGPLMALVQETLPHLRKTIGTLPPRITIVVGPDPLWRGGLSGEGSLYINQNLRLIDHDYTSTPLHELFHVAQRFEKANETADWIVEGLAEYYSLRILAESGQISRKQFIKGIRKFDRQGVWGVNLSTSTDARARYNSAPLIAFYLDEHLRSLTKGARSLRTLVHRLGTSTDVSNATLIAHLSKIAPQGTWAHFLTRYIFQGRRPPYELYLLPYIEGKRTLRDQSSKKVRATSE